MALPTGNSRKFQRKKPRKKGGKATSCHMHLHAPGTFKLYRETAMYFVCSGRKCEDGQGTCSIFPFPLHSYHTPQTNREGTPPFFPTKYKWMLPLALLEEMERAENSISGWFPPCNDITALSRLCCAHLQNQLICALQHRTRLLCRQNYTSFAATPGNGCLPSRKDCLQKETMTTSIRAGY